MRPVFSDQKFKLKKNRMDRVDTTLDFVQVVLQSPF